MEIYFDGCVCVHQWNDTVTSSWVQKGDNGQSQVYQWNYGRTSWVQRRGQDIADDEAGGDFSDNCSVSISGDGNIVAIGVYLNDGNGADSGDACFYQWSGIWKTAGDESGYSVSMSYDDGNIVAVGWSTWK
jgi:hypothetical protein